MKKESKLKYFFKTKIFTKTFGISAFALGGIALVSGAIAYKAHHKFKPVFYNYQSYLDKNIEERLNQSFDFKEFDTINEFTKAILTHKTIAGIGSDSQAANLIIGVDGSGSKLRRYKTEEFKKIFGAN
ncbi:UNVERIFIED_CONTAM: hypothetical protein O8I53_13180 [Campylobacter lari]